jgi:hypothetical protein
VADAVVSTLDRFGDAGQLMRASSADRAVARFEDALAATPCRVERPDAQVLVGCVEAVQALDVDHLWALDMDDRCWPPPANPNPLLGEALACALGIPGATAAQQTHRARAVTASLAGRVAEPRFSHARHHGEQTREASPLTRELTGVPVRGAPARAGPRLAVAPAVLEYLEDTEGPALTAGADNATIPPGATGIVKPPGAGSAPETVPPTALRGHEPRASGGAAVLSDQADCPFRAFARLRLGAQPLPDPVRRAQTGRSAVLQDALARLWSGLTDQGALRQELTAGVLASRVAGAVEAAMAAFERRGHAPPGGPAARALVCRHVAATLEDWLRLEAARPPFRVIATDRAVSLALGGMRLDLRLDRIDEIGPGDGRHLVIDYRFDACVPASHAEAGGERSRSQALAVYALALHPPPVGVACALLDRGRQHFTGIGVGPDLPVGVDETGGAETAPDNWADRVNAWRTDLDGLAREFAGGHALVDPRLGTATCRRCPLPALCRVGDPATGRESGVP